MKITHRHHTQQNLTSYNHTQHTKKHTHTISSISSINQHLFLVRHLINFNQSTFNSTNFIQFIWLNLLLYGKVFNSRHLSVVFFEHFHIWFLLHLHYQPYTSPFYSSAGPIQFNQPSIGSYFKTTFDTKFNLWLFIPTAIIYRRICFNLY